MNLFEIGSCSQNHSMNKVTFSTRNDMLPLNSYDVILNNTASESCIDVSRCVGNARFLVIIAMHSSRFSDATRHGKIETCYEIVSQLINIICHQTSPQGRFFGCTKDQPLKDLGVGKDLHDKIYQIMCHYHEEQLTPIEKARFARANKIAIQKQKPVNLNDDRFLVREDILKNHPNKRLKVEQNEKYRQIASRTVKDVNDHFYISDSLSASTPDLSTESIESNFEDSFHIEERNVTLEIDYLCIPLDKSSNTYYQWTKIDMELLHQMIV